MIVEYHLDLLIPFSFCNIYEDVRCCVKEYNECNLSRKCSVHIQIEYGVCQFLQFQFELSSVNSVIPPGFLFTSSGNFLPLTSCAWATGDRQG